MAPEDQRIAIAEACGWKRDERGWSRPDGSRAEHNEMLDVCYQVVQHDCPDFLNDLNAMHEAEKRIVEEAERGYRYDMMLYMVVQANEEGMTNFMKLWHATAAQRAEAFLRTIGKWIEEPATACK